MRTLVLPWLRPRRLLRAGAFVGAGFPLTLVSFIVVVVLLATTGSLLVTLAFAIPTAWLLFTASRALAVLDRRRVRALMAVEIEDPVPPLGRPTWWGRLVERARSKPRWREILHHLLSFPVASVGFVLSATAWNGSLTLLLLPLYVESLPGDTAKFGLFELAQGRYVWGAAATGLVGLVFVAPTVTLGAAQVQLAVARWLLGPRPGDADVAALTERVVEVEGQRSAAVDSAEAERRRIERDLHDGAQQRLVALAAGLGVAREKLDTDPDGARTMVADAHDEAKAALREIRDLVRGIHPVILEDRGLDAALSAVVARAPVPVALDVRIDRRPPPAVESTAYFVVNEALTNVARHAEATNASVSIARAGDRLVVEIHDDGVGGADASRGTGLQGLRERVIGAGGNLHVISPPGGPTTISVELPCGS